MNKPLRLATPPLDEEAMAALAAALAGAMHAPLVCYLRGELGAGKTTFVRAMLGALGYRGRVKSPSYGLLEHYPLKQVNILHLDLYRIENAGELEFLGIPDLIDSNTLLLVEWPERGAGALPEADFMIHTEHVGQRRKVTFTAVTPAAEPLLPVVRQFLNTFSS
jgi:tRNA threonylcarbamoyladenosine biosynthesis protein TsaE